MNLFSGRNNRRVCVGIFRCGGRILFVPEEIAYAEYLKDRGTLKMIFKSGVIHELSCSKETAEYIILKIAGASSNSARSNSIIERSD
jgi:hypothetical protein